MRGTSALKMLQTRRLSFVDLLVMPAGIWARDTTRVEEQEQEGEKEGENVIVSGSSCLS